MYCRYLLHDMLMTLMDYYGDGPGAVNDRVFAELKADLRGQLRQKGLLKEAGAGETGMQAHPICEWYWGIYCWLSQGDCAAAEAADEAGGAAEGNKGQVRQAAHPQFLRVMLIFFGSAKSSRR
jgi:hypothetical protein